MIDSLLNLDPGTKKKITEMLSTVLFPIKCYAIVIVLLLLLLNYNVYKLKIT